MKVSGRITIFMGKECIFGLTVGVMMESGRIINSMVRVYTTSLMEGGTKDNTLMT